MQIVNGGFIKIKSHGFATQRMPTLRVKDKIRTNVAFKRPRIQGLFVSKQKEIEVT
jgi:hypothetical protein